MNRDLSQCWKSCINQTRCYHYVIRFWELICFCRIFGRCSTVSYRFKPITSNPSVLAVRHIYTLFSHQHKADASHHCYKQIVEVFLWIEAQMGWVSWDVSFYWRTRAGDDQGRTGNQFGYQRVQHTEQRLDCTCNFYWRILKRNRKSELAGHLSGFSQDSIPHTCWTPASY